MRTPKALPAPVCRSEPTNGGDEFPIQSRAAQPVRELPKEPGFPKGVGFHAFRHTLATDLDHQGIRAEDVALITGHSVSKKVPVLQDSYYHKKPEAIRKRQLAALSLYRPAVQLTMYRRG